MVARLVFAFFCACVRYRSPLSNRFGAMLSSRERESRMLLPGSDLPLVSPLWSLTVSSPGKSLKRLSFAFCTRSAATGLRLTLRLALGLPAVATLLAFATLRLAFGFRFGCRLLGAVDFCLWTCFFLFVAFGLDFLGAAVRRFLDAVLDCGFRFLTMPTPRNEWPLGCWIEKGAMRCGA